MRQHRRTGEVPRHLAAFTTFLLVIGWYYLDEDLLWAPLSDDEQTEQHQRHEPLWVVPKVVHRTWKEDDEVAHTFETSWQLHNPGWRLRLYTDVGAERYVRRHLPRYLKAYLGLPTPVERADFFRYLVLLHEGGVYADVDVECLRPLGEYLPPDIMGDGSSGGGDGGGRSWGQVTAAAGGGGGVGGAVGGGVGGGLVVGWEWGSVPKGWCANPEEYQYARTSQLVQWVLASPPGHPALRALCDRIVATYNVTLSWHPNRNVLERTGPGAFTDAVLSYVREHPPGLASSWPVTFLPQARWGIDSSPDLQVRGIRHFLMGTWKTNRADQGAFGGCKPVGSSLPVTLQQPPGVTLLVAARYPQPSSAAAAAASSATTLPGGTSATAAAAAGSFVYAAAAEGAARQGDAAGAAGVGTLPVLPPYIDCGRDAAADLLYWGACQPGLDPWARPSVADALTALLDAAAADASAAEGAGSSWSISAAASTSAAAAGAAGRRGGRAAALGGGAGSSGAGGSGVTLLDIGAGYGQHSLAAAAAGHRAIALELAGSTAVSLLQEAAAFNGLEQQQAGEGLGPGGAERGGGLGAEGGGGSLTVVPVSALDAAAGSGRKGDRAGGWQQQLLLTSPPRADVVRVNGNGWELLLLLQGCLLSPGHGMASASGCRWLATDRPPAALQIALRLAALRDGARGASARRHALTWLRFSAGYSRVLAATAGCCPRRQGSSSAPRAPSWVLAPAAAREEAAAAGAVLHWCDVGEDDFMELARGAGPLAAAGDSVVVHMVLAWPALALPVVQDASCHG